MFFFLEVCWDNDIDIQFTKTVCKEENILLKFIKLFKPLYINYSFHKRITFFF